MNKQEKQRYDKLRRKYNDLLEGVKKATDFTNNWSFTAPHATFVLKNTIDAIIPYLSKEEGKRYERVFALALGKGLLDDKVDNQFLDDVIERLERSQSAPELLGRLYLEKGDIHSAQESLTKINPYKNYNKEDYILLLEGIVKKCKEE